MELSRFERLIVSNQFKILEKLNPESSEIYERHRKAIEEGYKLHYDWIMENIHEEELSIESCREILDILSMYRALNFSIEKISSEEREEIDPEDIKFKGFDGNNEAKRLAYVKYFLHDLNRFEELRDDTEYPDYNSHFENLNEYRKMLEQWKSMNKKNHLEASEIRKILDCGNPTKI